MKDEQKEQEEYYERQRQKAVAHAAPNERACLYIAVGYALCARKIRPNEANEMASRIGNLKAGILTEKTVVIGIVGQKIYEDALSKYEKFKAGDPIRIIPEIKNPKHWQETKEEPDDYPW